MKDAIRALRAERKRLLAAVKQVDRALKATGASEGKAKRPRRRTSRKALGTAPLSGDGKGRSGAAAKAGTANRAAGENTDVAPGGVARVTSPARKPASTPVQPAESKIGARRPGAEGGPTSTRPRANVDDLLKD